METLIIKTNERTINNKVKSLVKANVSNVSKATKTWVPHIGYVVYLYNRFGAHLGNICKDNGTITIRINH